MPGFPPFAVGEPDSGHRSRTSGCLGDVILRIGISDSLHSADQAPAEVTGINAARELGAREIVGIMRAAKRIQEGMVTGVTTIDRDET